MAAGLLGFTIRQYAVVPPVAVAALAGWMLWHERPRARLRAFAVMCLGVLVGAAVFWAYWRTIPHPKAFSPAMPSGHSIRATVYKGTGLVRLLGLLVAPAVIAANPRRLLARSWTVAKDTTVFMGVGVITVLAFTASAAPTIAFAGNYITPNGILASGVAAGRRADILPPGMFNTLLAVGTSSAALLAIALVPFLHEVPIRLRTRELAPRDPVNAFIALVVAGYGAAYSLAAITGIPLYDRYVLPTVPLVALLLLRNPPARLDHGKSFSPSARTRALAVVAACVLGFVGLVYTADSAAFDGARWKVASDATEAGWTRPQIRGGFEWTNFYAGTRIGGRHGAFCVKIVVDPPHGVPREVVARGEYRSPLRDAVPVIAIRTRLPCTPGRRIAH
jgi:hypothetical protein